MFVIEPDRFRKLRKSVLWKDCCNELHGSENSHYNLSTKMLDKCAICFYCIYSMEQRLGLYIYIYTSPYKQMHRMDFDNLDEVIHMQIGLQNNILKIRKLGQGKGEGPGTFVNQEY